MASIWFADSRARGGRKLAGRLSEAAAIKSLHDYADVWRQSQETIGLDGTITWPRSVQVVSLVEYHLIQDGNVVAHIWIELLSPPSTPSGGDQYRAKPASA